MEIKTLKKSFKDHKERKFRFKKLYISVPHDVQMAIDKGLFHT